MDEIGKSGTTIGVGVQRLREMLPWYNAVSALTSLRLHWPEYLMEACELGLYMFFTCVFATFLQHPASPVRAPEVTRRNTRAHFIQPLKERIVREVGYGLSLEGASAADLVKSMGTEH